MTTVTKKVTKMTTKPLAVKKGESVIKSKPTTHTDVEIKGKGKVQNQSQHLKQQQQQQQQQQQPQSTSVKVSEVKANDDKKKDNKISRENIDRIVTKFMNDYDISEKDAILDWFMENWDDYVGVSFLFRNDPTKTAADLGYAYLPQEVVTKEQYKQYVSEIGQFDLDEKGQMVDNLDTDCTTGACPIR